MLVHVLVAAIGRRREPDACADLPPVGEVAQANDSVLKVTAPLGPIPRKCVGCWTCVATVDCGGGPFKQSRDLAL